MNQFAKATGTSKDDRIVLGDRWKQFAFTTDALDYLGTIRRGMEIGALAKDPAGGYWQVNGDIRQELNKSRVAALLRTAIDRRHPVAVTGQPRAERAAVTVVVKPSRCVVVPPR